MKKISIDSNKSPNFIGSWNIENDKLCNEIIKFFEDNESLQKKGSTALGYNPKIKQTTDITIIPSELKDPKYSLFNSYFNLLKDCFLDYRNQYPFLKHKFFDKEFLSFEEGKVPLLHKMIPANIKNLYFIGLFQPLGCIWPGAELQSKLAAKHLKGSWKPKKPLDILIKKELDNPAVNQIDTPRHTITVDDFSFRQRLKKELARAN